MTARRRGNEVEENTNRIHSRIQVIPIITTSIVSTEKKTKQPKKPQTNIQSNLQKCIIFAELNQLETAQVLLGSKVFTPET